MEAWVAEIKLRANVRIGELSKALEKAIVEGKSGNVRLPEGGKSKTKALKEAGISTSQASQCEKLAEPRVKEKLESYIMKMANECKPVTITGAVAAVERDRKRDNKKEELATINTENLTAPVKELRRVYE